MKLAWWVGVWLAIFGAHPSWAQSDRGSIQLSVQSLDKAPVAATGTLVSLSQKFDQYFATGAGGHFFAINLTFGTYVVTVTAPGFAPVSRLLQVSSPVPIFLRLQLSITPVQQSASVEASSTLLDLAQAGSSVALDGSQLQNELPPQPGRSLLDVIADQPGWIFEANGVLHPRGSEYETQFVINGVPRTENLSPSFADPIPAGTVESALVRTAGIPAEFGRSLGGVVDITTGSTRRSGWHGLLSTSGGSFATVGAEARLGFGTARQQLVLFANGSRTDRFLDPPVVANYSNRATPATASVDEQVTLSAASKLELDYSYASLHSMVPNELVQQQAGQRQDRGSRQDSGSLSWQHTFSPALLLTAAGGVLDTEAITTSNAEATPVDVEQQRGFRQGWLHSDVAGHLGHNDWKVGADAILRNVHEQLGYTVTEPSAFDPGTQQNLRFAQRLWDVEPAAFAEDLLHLGRWNVSAGLRYDDYSFVLQREAWSPRIAVSRYLPVAHLVLHASYDRVFQIPAIENLLLASSPAFDSVSDFVQRLPVQPAYAHYYEFGFAEEIASRVRLTGNFFLRTFRNYADDDTLLNTGVSFPIADASARIQGEEVSVYVPEWHHVLAQVSYSNQVGTASGPITGGLFIGDEGTEELATRGRFPISQDQRNTVRAQARWSPLHLLWFGIHAQYNSGLPVEIDGDLNLNLLRQAYGNQIIGAVNFDEGRVLPWSSIDLASGINLLSHGERRVQLELHTANVANRVNVINFASLFSGTAVAPPRSYDARLRISF